MPKSKKPSVEFYAIVCTELHNALGPIPGEAVAAKVARMMTDSSSGCVYVPVPLNFTGVIVSEKDFEDMAKSSKKPSTEEVYGGGQYL